jgi:hypothetical protein
MKLIKLYKYILGPNLDSIIPPNEENKVRKSTIIGSKK